MEAAAKLISALAALAWPLVFGLLLIKLFPSIRELVESARGRKFSIKVAGNELTMEEASEQQRMLLSDVQGKLADLEKRLPLMNAGGTLSEPQAPTGNRILWVDDKPKGNSVLVESLEERGWRVDTAASTDEALRRLEHGHFDLLISDMSRPEGRKAGIDLARKVQGMPRVIPVYIYCGKSSATNLREEALAAGVTEITSSASTLMALLER